MPINLKAMPTSFIPSPIKEREAKAEEKRRAACFYTLRDLMWQSGKSSIFREAKENGTLVPTAPGVRNANGYYEGEEYDEEDIKAVYKQAWEDFSINFDATFIHATSAELATFSKERFGYGLPELLELNAERSAARFNRAQ